MSKLINDFLNSLKNEFDFFWFCALYHRPSVILGNDKNMDNLDSEYKSLPLYFWLMMNNNLTEFVKIAIQDDDFLKRADANILIKLSYILYDSADFKKYHSFRNDKNLLSILNNQITIPEYNKLTESSNTRYSLPQLLEINTIYNKYKHLYEHPYPEEQIEQYSGEKAMQVRANVVDIINYILDKTTRKQKEKESVLELIEQEDYSDSHDNSSYLCRNPLLYRLDDPNIYYLNKKVFNYLVCDNQFLSIIEEKLSQKSINGSALDNAIDIISMGIRIKKNLEHNMTFCIHELGIDFIQQFDLKRSQELLNKLILYQLKINNGKCLCKVIPFKQKVDK